MHEFWVALPPTIVAFTGLIVGILQTLRSKRNRSAAKKQLGEIHDIVNGQRAEREARLRQRITALEQELEKRPPVKPAEPT